MPIKKKPIVRFAIPRGRFLLDPTLRESFAQARREYYSEWTRDALIEALIDTEWVLDAVDRIRLRLFDERNNGILKRQEGAEKKHAGNKAHLAKEDIKRCWT